MLLLTVKSKEASALVSVTTGSVLRKGNIKGFWGSPRQEVIKENF